MQDDNQTLIALAEAVKDYANQVLAAHIRDLGERPRNKRYQDSIREDIALAENILRKYRS